MSWQLGGTDGVVDALDAHGRPMPVGMPAANEDDLFAGHGVTFERLNDQPMVSHASRWHPAALHFTIGFWSGAAAAVLVMVWLR